MAGLTVLNDWEKEYMYTMRIFVLIKVVHRKSKGRKASKQHYEVKLDLWFLDDLQWVSVLYIL